MAENDVNVTFGAQIENLTKAIDTVKNQLGTLNGAVGQVAGWFGQLNNISALVAGTLGTLGLDSFARQMAQAGIEAQRMSMTLGLTGKEMLTLKAAAAFSGVEMSSLVLAIERLSLRMQQSTRDALSPQSQALKNLGLNVQELIKLPAHEFFLKVAEAAERFNPGLKLTTTMMEIGGRQMAQMAAAFQAGTVQLQEFTTRLAASKTGLEGWKQAAVDTAHNFEIMDSAVSSLSKQIFTALAPAINVLINRMTDFSNGIRDSIKAGGAWSIILDVVAGALKVIVSGLIIVTGALSNMVEKANIAYLSLKGLFTDTAKQVQESAARIRATNEEMADQIKKVWEKTAAERVAAGHEAVKREIEDINFLARQQLTARIAEIESDIKLVEIGFQRKQILYERDVLNLTKTESQKVTATIAATNERYAAEVALLQKELALGGLMPEQIAQIEARITQIKAQAINERLKLENEYVKAVQQQWNFLESALSSSFSTQLRGLLAGTTSWKNAMKAIFADVVTAAINEFLKLAIIKPIIQALSSAFSPAEFLADILKVVTKLLGQVFMGATAFFAPMLGPYAPAAGLAVAATAEAAEASISGFEQGAWSVPQTATALVHRDEMILPVDFASAVRSALSGGAMGGASNLTVSIQAWDAASVARWLRVGGADMLARAISAQYNQNPTIRPRY